MEQLKAEKQAEKLKTYFRVTRELTLARERQAVDGKFPKNLTQSSARKIEELSKI